MFYFLVKSYDSFPMKSTKNENKQMQ